MPPKPKCAAPAAPVPKYLARLSDEYDDFRQNIVARLPGWRDEQRALVQAACDEAAKSASVATVGEVLDLIASAPSLSALEDKVQKIEPFEIAGLPDNLNRKLLDQRIEEAVTGVDDDVESVVEAFDLLPEFRTDDGSAQDKLYEAFEYADPSIIGAELGTYLSESCTHMAADECFRDLLRTLSPDRRARLAELILTA